MIWNMRLSRNQPCPCHSGRKAKSCCGPWLQGVRHRPVALMRSRYAAYALGMTRYIMETTDPDGPLHEADRDRWATSIDAFCAATQFDGLTIHAHTEESTEGAVDFSARSPSARRTAPLRAQPLHQARRALAVLGPQARAERVD